MTALQFTIPPSLMPFLYVLTPIIGGIFSIIALVWTYFLKKNIESVKNDQMKNLNVHRLQFEKEFLLYQEMWKYAAKLRKILYEVQSHHSQYFQDIEDEKDETVKKKNIETLNDSRKMLKETEKEMNDFVLANEPFFPEDVFLKIADFMNKSYFTNIYIVFPELGVSMKKEFIETHIKEAISTLDSISLSIRNRIGMINKG